MAKSMKFGSTVEINAPIEKIWAVLDNLEEWHQWAQFIKKIEMIPKGPPTVGSQVYIIARGWYTFKLLLTITEYVPGRSVFMQGKTLGTKLIRFYTLEPISQKTRVTAGGEVSGILAWLVRRGGQSLSDEIVQALKKKVEGLG